MSDYLNLLFGKAFKTIAGTEYNRTLAELSSEGGSFKGHVFYEVPLLEAKPWAYLRDKVYPGFVRYLKHKAIDPETCDHVVVVVFFKDRCFLLEGSKFLDVFREMEGLTGAALHFRILQWLSG